MDSCEEYATTQKMMDRLFSEAEDLLPGLKRDMIIGAYAGIRSKIVPPGDTNFGDFIIEENPASPGMINLIGIESPGLTASIPIAERVCDMLGIRFGLKEKNNWIEQYKGYPVFRELDIHEQNRLIKEDPDYGEIVCRCENITKAEVLTALNNPLGAKTLTAVKNRVRTMTGRCQGGYCFSNLVDIMTLDLGIDISDITFKRKGDRPFYGRAK